MTQVEEYRACLPHRRQHNIVVNFGHVGSSRKEVVRRLLFRWKDYMLLEMYGLWCYLRRMPLVSMSRPSELFTGAPHP